MHCDCDRCCQRYPTEMTAMHIYIYTQYIHDMTYWQNISSHIWGHEVAALGASTLTKVALLSVAQGKDIACSNLSGPSRVAICLYFLWCGWCSCDPTPRKSMVIRQSCKTPRLIRLKKWMRRRHVGLLDSESQRDVWHKSSYSSSCGVMWIPV